jgi:hypothetical protein
MAVLNIITSTQALLFGSYMNIKNKLLKGK